MPKFKMGALKLIDESPYWDLGIKTISPDAQKFNPNFKAEAHS